MPMAPWITTLNGLKATLAPTVALRPPPRLGDLHRVRALSAGGEGWHRVLLLGREALLDLQLSRKLDNHILKRTVAPG